MIVKPFTVIEVGIGISQIENRDKSNILLSMRKKRLI